MEYMRKFVTIAALGVAMNKLAIEPARGAPVVSLIIITIGASIFIRLILH